MAPAKPNGKSGIVSFTKKRINKENDTKYAHPGSSLGFVRVVNRTNIGRSPSQPIGPPQEPYQIFICSFKIN